MTRFIGKFIGTILGLSIASWGGGLIGFIIGHLHDQSLVRKLTRHNHIDENIFFPDFQIDSSTNHSLAMSLIVLGAKLAKCDGIVNETEILAFKRVFPASEPHIHEIGNLFNQARASAEGYEPHAARLAQIFSLEHEILEDILTRLFYIAKSDSTHLAREEILFLRRIAVMFGFSEGDFIRAAANAGIYLKPIPTEGKKKTPYDVLGIPASSSDEVVKQTYRALVRKFHPDKLQASGLPQVHVDEASEKIKQITAAYAEICKTRKI